MEELYNGVRYLWLEGPSYQGNGLGRIKNMLSFLRGLKNTAHRSQLRESRML